MTEPTRLSASGTTQLRPCRTHCFGRATQPSNIEPHKCDDLAWFSLDALPDRMIPYCREALHHIAAQHPFSLYGW